MHGREVPNPQLRILQGFPFALATLGVWLAGQCLFFWRQQAGCLGFPPLIASDAALLFRRRLVRLYVFTLTLPISIWHALIVRQILRQAIYRLGRLRYTFRWLPLGLHLSAYSYGCGCFGTEGVNA